MSGGLARLKDVDILKLDVDSLRRVASQEESIPKLLRARGDSGALVDRWGTEYSEANLKGQVDRREYCEAVANRWARLKLYCELRVAALVNAGQERGEIATSKNRGEKWSPGATDLAGLGIDKRDLFRWRLIAEVPQTELETYLERTDTITTKGVYQYFLERKRKADRERLAEEGRTKPREAVDYRLIHASVADLALEPESVDVIITDPPYKVEYLTVYRDLSRVADKVLKPGGACVVMTGQRWLFQVMRFLGARLEYHWTCAYLTPGGESSTATVVERSVNTFWKPVLVFSKGWYGGQAYGDVIRSAGNAKEAHRWGQSESGMSDLVDRFSDLGQLILDPFVGGGATGVSALLQGRRFVGSDCDESAISITAQRLSLLQPA